MCPSHETIRSARQAGTRKVLVIDDEPTLRLGFAYALTNSETKVDTAASGREGLQRLEADPYDIIILDLRMPEMDGLGVIEALRGNGACVPGRAMVPIVLCSGLAQPHATLRAIRRGVVDFLLKPLRPADLRQVVEFVLHPEDDPLSQALQEVRQQRPGGTIKALELQAVPESRALMWLDLLKLIRDAPQGGEAADLADDVRSRFCMLAFNSPFVGR